MLHTELAQRTCPIFLLATSSCRFILSEHLNVVYDIGAEKRGGDKGAVSMSIVTEADVWYCIPKFR